MIDYFPLTTASGAAFCNRTLELKQLKNNFELVRPTLVMSPRRYGKTSLVLNALRQSKSIFSHVDFYKLLDDKDVEQSILTGIANLLSQVETKPENLMRLLRSFFSTMKISVGMGSAFNFSISRLSDSEKPVQVIQDALTKLHDFLKKKKLKAVFYIDEFQKLSEITADHAIEAGLREVAQQSKHIVYVFSGSNRHLMEDMFFESARPFYKLCDTIRLSRISQEHYLAYIASASKKRWKKPLPEKTILKILELTQCHPYYVNFLCSKLFLNTFPSTEKVEETWKQAAAENRSQIEREIDNLARNQRKLLIALSRFGPTDQPTSAAFSSRSGVPAASLAQALGTLLRKDYLFKNEEGFYQVLDPLFAYLLA